MKINRTLVAAAAGLFIAGIAVPASADTGVTNATVTVTGGTLGISVPVDAGSLGSLANTVAGGTINGSLGVVVVSDARSLGAGAGWVVTVISTAFTPPAGPTIGAALVSYSPGSITKVGTATYTPSSPGNLTGASVAITATAITGDNSATWNPTIHIAVPGGTVAATYSGMITHSVV
jgi:hypothetical protein